MNENDTSSEKKELLRLKADFLKLEYEKCIEAYFDIYGSIWKIFSYMATITAAFLIASKEFFPQLEYPSIILIAPIPLIFWWIGIYSPMNRYGEMRLEKIKKIEEAINKLKECSDIPDLCYFSEFKEKKGFWGMLKEAKLKFWKPSDYMRVKFAANVVGYFLTLVFIGFFAFLIYCLATGKLYYFIDP